MTCGSVGNARLVKSDKNIYGIALTQDGRELHYIIITYIENAVKNVCRRGHACEEYALPCSGGGKSRFTFNGFLTKDEALLLGIASTYSTLIIYGDTGIGKSMRAASPHRDRPFISFNYAPPKRSLKESCSATMAAFFPVPAAKAKMSWLRSRTP